MTKVTLNTKTTSGDLSWNKYVLNNDCWKDLELDVVCKTYILNKNGGKEIELFENDRIGILETNRLQDVLNVPSRRNFGQCYFAFTNSGYTAIHYIRKPTLTNVLSSEEEAIKRLNYLIKDFGKPINIEINGEVYKNIVGCRNIDGTPKADFSLYNYDMNDVVFISHKKSGGAKAFQQYSGISRKSKLNNNIEIINFLSDVDYIVSKNNGVLKNAIYREINSVELINKSIFGPDYGKCYGPENCQIIGQGEPYFEPLDIDVLRLSWSDHSICNGDLNKLVEDYTPVIGVTFRNGRKIDTKFGSIYNVRGGIYPIGVIKNRKNSMVI